MTRLPPRRRATPPVLLVGLGGALGALGRWSAGMLGEATWTTLCVNALGCLAMGVLLGAVGSSHPRTRAFLGTGVLGGFTTFSTSIAHAHAAGPLAGAAWLIGTLAGCLAAAWSGLHVGRRTARRRLR